VAIRYSFLPVVPIQHNRNDSQRAVLDIRIPADLLVQAPTKYELHHQWQKHSVSKVPPALLARADEVIE
jgi:hypothetical protein